jgi:hypothetical protein
MPKKSKAAPELVRAAERRAKAVELRKLGFTYKRISDQLGVSVPAAHQMVAKALRELNELAAEEAAEVRRLELERLDDYQVRIAQEIQAGRGLKAIDVGLRIMTRRAKLLGLDAPTRMDVSENTQHWIDELIAAAQAGDASARNALAEISAGRDVTTSCLGWIQRARWRMVHSPEDLDRMTADELREAASGLMTLEKLREIRERPAKNERADS